MSGWPASFWMSASSRTGFVAELARQFRECLPVDGNAAAFHARQYLDQRTLQRLVDVRHALGGEPGLQNVPEPQRDVGVFGGIFGGLADFDTVESHPGLSGLGDFVVVDHRVIEIAPRQRAEPMIGAAGIDHVGHQQRVVVGRNRDPALRENLPVEFQVLADLEYAGVFEQRLDGFECVLLGNLVRLDTGIEQAFAAAILLVRERDITGFVRRHRQREAAQCRLHRIERIGLGIDCDMAVLDRAHDPGFQPRKIAHDFVFGAVEREWL